ncbi:MAG: hydantoinase/oxoprolinase family protein [Alphaproteobacteria bacterium]|nr:hydantoinase/oxoprolinase family protein [Alphaproteobacteria bacterium]
MTDGRQTRIGADIGGTFTDIVLEHGGRQHYAKVLTDRARPGDSVLRGIDEVLAAAGVGSSDVHALIHGTTLATNALIERRGAPTVLLTTAGFRDVIEIGDEGRFSMFDMFLDKPAPLVPRPWRLAVPERIKADGSVLEPLDEQAVTADVLPALARTGAKSVAICLLHAYRNAAHEARLAEMVRAALPDVHLSLSSEVSPEVREYERFSTTVANAYVQPVMARYLAEMDEGLRARGFRCPLLLLHSGGGLMTLATARRFPVRLVESGPAGGAILSASVAAAGEGLERVVSFDMGGTTAKICLIDDHRPQTAKTFEVARIYRFLKGSGLPLRIPVIEMVEIGAGGGSIAAIDNLGRVTVGPESAGSEPGPACYGLGGTRPTVTDADLVLGRIDPDNFAGGRIRLDVAAAERALAVHVGKPLGLDVLHAALAVCEVVDENMVNALRVHAVERGKDAQRYAMIAFGGAAPLHAARLVQKLGLRRMIVPTGAGVGSAIGFLRAPLAYEVLRSQPCRIEAFAGRAADSLLREMADEGAAVVRLADATAPLGIRRTAFMRYVGQGHEIEVEVPEGSLAADGRARLTQAFEAGYARAYGRTIPHLGIELLSWSVTVSGPVPPVVKAPTMPATFAATPRRWRPVFDPATGRRVEAAVFRRHDLAPGATLSSPAVVDEAESTTVVPPGFDLVVDGLGYLALTRR